MASRLRGRISPDLEQLRGLHKQYWWIPSPDQIRPRYCTSVYTLGGCILWVVSLSACNLIITIVIFQYLSDEVRALKEASMARITNDYRSPTDFVLSDIFGAPTARLPVCVVHYIVCARAGGQCERGNMCAACARVSEHALTPLKGTSTPKQTISQDGRIGVEVPCSWYHIMHVYVYAYMRA